MSRFVALCRLPLLLFPFVFGAHAGAQERCRSFEWSPPRMLWHSSDSAAIHPEDADADSSQLIVTGAVVARIVEPSAIADPATAMGLRVDLATGRVIEIRRPVVRMSYDAMRVVIDRGGVGHLFWREIAGETVDDTTGGPGATQVWTLRLAGDSVGTPELVVSTRDAMWDAALARPGVGIDRHGRLHLVLINRGAYTHYPVVHLVREGARWSVHRPRFASAFMPQQLSIALDASFLNAAFTSPNVEEPRLKLGSLYFARMSLDDMQWSAARLVRDAGTRPAQAPMIAVAPGGEIRLFWKAAVDSSEMWNARRLQLASSLDGVRFQEREGTMLAQNVMRTPQLFTDACGSTWIHAVTARIGGTVSLHPVQWDGDRWSVWPPLDHRFEFESYTSLTTGVPGRVTRIWSEVLFGPYLPTRLIWYESHRSVAMPTP